jgi:glycosyltransferase involved in cell wall biosynthesis
MKRILVVNSTYPQLRHVSIALSSVKALSHYVNFYMESGSWFEKFASRIPGLGSTFEKRLLNRKAWDGLEPGQVVNIPLPLAVLRDIVARAKPDRRGWVARTNRALTKLSDRWVDRLASRLVSRCDAVLAVNNCALLTFREAKRQGKATFLDYPIGHHRSKSRAMAEEAARWPDYASSWRAEDEHPSVLARQDEEIQLADRIWVGSDFVKRTFLENGVAESKLAVLCYGTDLSRFHSIERRPRPGPVRCLFAGQVGQRKGASYLFEAFRKPFSVDAKLLLAGELAVDPRLVPPAAEALGHQSLPAMDKLYAEADIFVLPTLWEGMPLSVLEAMAAGLPVVATPCGPAEVVRDGVDGFIVPDRDPDAIHAAIEKLATDPELRAKMGASGRERSKHYTWENYKSRSLEELGCSPS